MIHSENSLSIQRTMCRWVILPTELIYNGGHAYTNDSSSSFQMQQVVLPRKFRTTSNCIPTLPALTKENSSTKLSNGNGSIASSKASNGSSSSSSISEDAIAANDSTTNGNQSNQTASLHSPGQLLTRQALHTYQSNNHLVHYKYSAYSGSYHELPKWVMISRNYWFSFFPLQIKFN